MHTYPTPPKIRTGRTRKPTRTNHHVTPAPPRCIMINKHRTIYHIIDIHINITKDLFSIVLFVSPSFHLFTFSCFHVPVFMVQSHLRNNLISSQSIPDLHNSAPPMVAFLSFDPQLPFSLASSSKNLSSRPIPLLSFPFRSSRFSCCCLLK